MDTKDWRARKVTIVGAGNVGATFAYALAQSGVADELALVDRNQDLVAGQVLDLSHGRFFFPTVDIHAGDKHDYADAHVIVVTAGTGQKPGESRLALLQRNVLIIDSIVDEIVAQQSRAVILIVSNPVDILTYVAHRRSGWARGRVIGSGTVLDSARFRYQLSEHCNVDVHNVHAYILGEHGDSEFAAWSMTHLGGVSIDRFCALCQRCTDWTAERAKIEQGVRDSAYHIIDYKGATYYAVGLALTRIVASILRNEHSVLSVSTPLEGEYGLSGVSLSVPCIVSQEGIDRIMLAALTPDEQAALERSAGILRDTLAQLQAR
ncbi:MAG: L-lactate dehydrogenase [Anaerolineae bacterium]|jgi:L-lactate dehydrogenase|nr:L-lactate dehydrogenase [Anaerolineae bacterium]